MDRPSWRKWPSQTLSPEEGTTPEVLAIHEDTHETSVVGRNTDEVSVAKKDSVEFSAVRKDVRDSPYLSALLDYTRDVVVVLTEGGLVSYTSSAMERILGHSMHSLLGGNLLEWIHPEDRSRFFEEFCMILRPPHRDQSCMFRFLHSTGEWRSLEGYLYHRVHAPMIGGIVLAVRDSTEQQEVEEQLRNSEAKNRTLLEAIPDLMFFLDRWGRVSAFKEDVIRWTPRPQEYSRRQQYVILSTSELLELSRKQTEYVFQSQSPVFFECRLELPSGYRDYEVRVVPGTQDEALVIVRDITEKNRLQAELLKANRMAELGTLVASMGHEINNPLTYIINHLEEMYDQLQKVRDVLPYSMVQHLRELTRESLEGSQRIARLVRDLKSYVREEKIPLTEVDVHRVIDQALQMAGNQIHHRAQLHRNYQPVPYVQAETGRLEQVFLNLLLNATQAFPDVSDHPCEIRIETSYQAEHHTVHISISDTGTGIAPEHLDHIFEPFFTTKPVGAGTGLGLFVCRNIILKMGGTLQASSQVGQGTTMTVVLPVSDTHVYTPAPSPLRHQEANPHQTHNFDPSLFPEHLLLQMGTASSENTVPSEKTVSPKKHAMSSDVAEAGMLAVQKTSSRQEEIAGDQEHAKLSILIVDDEPRVAQSLRRILREHHVVIVLTGQEAVEHCSQHAYHWVFCDLSMPDITGQDVFVRVCQQNPQYREKFIFMTGGAFLEQTRQFCETVDRPILEKPFDREQIRSLLRGF